MEPSDLLLIVMLTALTLYAVLGGADFGVGVWECVTALRSSEKERKHVYSAIGPVWEANHVWLIFVLVILLNGFPKAFAALSRALWLPLLLALAGIVFRGAGYVFRSYGHGSRRQSHAWEAVFAVASTLTPFCLGACAGAIASGDLVFDAQGRFDAAYHAGWLHPLGVFTGVLSVVMCAYLSAVYLTYEADKLEDRELFVLWRTRAALTGLLMGALSLSGLVIVWIETPALAEGFKDRAWPLVFASVGCGVWSLAAIARHRPFGAALGAIGAVAAILWGWGVAQYPAIVPPGFHSADAHAPNAVLWWMLAVIAAGSVLLLPALGYLFVLFKRGKRESRAK